MSSAAVMMEGMTTTADAPAAVPHVVIVGGGFGGLAAARALGDRPVAVTLIDRLNYHLFQPLLYQVALAELAATDVAYPIRRVLRSQQNVEVLLAEVAGFDLGGRKVLLSDGTSIAYDYLIVAAGARTSYFGHEDWARFAPGIKDLDDALEVRRRVLTALEAADHHERGQPPPLLVACRATSCAPTSAGCAPATCAWC
jgi:NADH dehydrogenase